MYKVKSCFPTYCCCLAAQSCLTLCNPMDCSPLDSPVHRMLQARILEWVTISSSRESFLTQGSNSCLLHLLHWQAESLLVSHQGNPSTPKYIINKNCVCVCLCVYTLSQNNEALVFPSKIHGPKRCLILLDWFTSSEAADAPV